MTKSEMQARLNDLESRVVPPEDLWFLLLCSMRYCHGRKSYAPGTVQQLIGSMRGALAATPTLRAHRLNQFAEETEKEISRCEDRSTFLGADFDHEGWRRFAVECRQWAKEER